MKIGFDFHGVLDLEDSLFRDMAKLAVNLGYEVHVLTGSNLERFVVESKDIIVKGVHYTHFFSVCDYLIENGIENTGTLEHPTFDSDIWNAAKGEYAFYASLDIHYDDCEIYSESFPKTCVFILIKDGEVV